MHAIILTPNEEDQNAQKVKLSLKLAGHGVIESRKFTHAIEVFSQHVALIIEDVHLENPGKAFDFIRWVTKIPQLKAASFLFIFSRQQKQSFRRWLNEDGAHGSGDVHNDGNF